MATLGRAAFRPASSEYDFLIGRHLDPATLAKARALAQRWHVPPHDILIAKGWIGAEDYVRALAEQCGVDFVPLRAMRSLRLLRPGMSARETLRRGLLKTDDGRIVYAPGRAQPDTVRQALNRVQRGRVCLTTPATLRRAVAWLFARDFTANARGLLHRRQPERSALSPLPLWQRIAGPLGLLAVCACLLLSVEATVQWLSQILVVVFVPVVGLRLLALLRLARARAEPESARLADADLPVYTLLVPLYREAKVVRQLCQALSRIDYPAAKLDIKLILEIRDRETIAAVQTLKLPGSFEIVAVPDFEPYTKPKALNFALPLARGEYLAIYDAEDVPEPDQLRKALAAFKAGPPTLACVQARLAIENARQSWLTRQFALEYGVLFRGLLPTLDQYRLPIPLGGTSNHFRVSALRWAAAWDAFNVTEDADLGMRLARSGYGCGVIDSTTYEEAPVRLWPWLRQRTRWMKGYIQTWCVHMRAPVRLWRELGPRGFLGFQLMIGGTLLSALVHPWFYVLAVCELVRGAFFGVPGSVLGWPLWLLAGFDLAAGYLGAMALGFACTARRQPDLRRQVPLMPVYWLLVSVAAYRALWQFFTARFVWEKTEHGLTRR